MNTKFALLIILTVSALFTSCSDNDGDTTAPVITLNAPAEGGQLKIGHGVHFSMELSDNEMLKSYKVEIHENMTQPHDHTRSDAAANYFSYDNTWDVSEYKSISIHHHEIEIPDDVTPGNYHFIVYCLDAAGNQSHVARNIELVISDDADDDDDDHDHE